MTTKKRSLSLFSFSPGFQTYEVLGPFEKKIILGRLPKFEQHSRLTTVGGKAQPSKKCSKKTKNQELLKIPFFFVNM